MLTSQYAVILLIVIIMVLVGAILGYVKRDDVSHISHYIYTSTNSVTRYWGLF